MTELRSILKAYRKNFEEHKWMALVTVLQVRGSSYRQPGARMLITEDGEIFGSVSGGCLERDLIQQAKVAFHSKTGIKIKVLQYDTTEDGDEYEALKSVSLACQGIIDLSLEIIHANERHPFLEKLSSHTAEEKTLKLATAVSSGIPLLEPQASISQALQKLNRTSVKTIDGEAYLLEKLDPPKRWVIFGASHDSVPLAQLGSFLGWHVIVVNCQSSYTVPARFFAGVDELVKCAPAEISKKVRLNSKTLCALVTHNYYHDMEILKQLIQSDVGYIGLLGPKKKGVTILEDLRKENPKLDLSKLFHLHSPAGLDTGAEDPHGVALSIITEALAVTSGRTGGFLKDRSGPIHSRDLS
jgi:xanthine/CO dehydrogenase XdhC/CoxF family maturation factor